MEQQRGNKRAVFGIILIVLGFFLIISNYGLLPFRWHHVLISWQGLLILIGTVMLFSRQNQPTGWILIFIGGFFLLPRLMHVSYDWNDLFWPAVLLGLGSIIIIREVTRRRIGRQADADFIDIASFFGGGDRIITSRNFQGGRITAIFGGSKLDLRQARLAEGKNELDLFLMFGGVKLIVPADWNVRMEVSSLFGGFSDKRHFSGKDTSDPGRELVVKGMAIFGGGDLVSF